MPAALPSSSRSVPAAFFPSSSTDYGGESSYSPDSPSSPPAPPPLPEALPFGAGAGATSSGGSSTSSIAITSMIFSLIPTAQFSWSRPSKAKATSFWRWSSGADQSSELVGMWSSFSANAMNSSLQQHAAAPASATQDGRAGTARSFTSRSCGLRPWTAATRPACAQTASALRETPQGQARFQNHEPQACPIVRCPLPNQRIAGVPNVS